MPGVVVRPITGADELDLFCRLPYVLNHQLAADLEGGRRQPSWMWVCMRGEHLLARAAWWARDGDDSPACLDIFDVDDRAEGMDRIRVGADFLRAAMGAVMPEGPKPLYIRFTTPDWRADVVERRAVDDRMAALKVVGAQFLVERLRLEWRPGTPIMATSGRLTFRPVSDRDELVGLMAKVLEGTLDAHSRADLARMSAAETAAAQYDEELKGYSSPRSWWAVALADDGQRVGFVIPARNPYGPIIAYVGVLPAHRGHGYIDDLLAEGTRILAADGTPRIRASTDVGNGPMRQAFQRAGYVEYEREVDMTWR
ncbi:MAG: GNAT family N-acetyltransferase [Candidatus Dormibacteraeota bacterium]|uniref:GNAT family N-acetyltransferase n=1 Tax=Candidatus Amunia macphersoniae TaxID=3127014 RepID=A0A934KI67_9BACT|nr:GNAT family N-acetyltransferase [Candidatus Dormibacteraeota bacterium]